jgi:hypothetical protein
MKRDFEDMTADENALFEIIGKSTDWITLEDGDLKGTRCGKDRTSRDTVALSSRHSLEAFRWIKMPSLASFQNLKELDLHKSRYMHQLDASVCDLVNLETLILTRCEKLNSLPEDIGRLKNLREVSPY